MLVSNCFRGIRLTKDINSRHIRTLAPQAYALIEGSAKTLINTAGRKLFGPTGEEIVRDVDLGDKYCLITGANGGLGLEMTRCLNARDAHVLMACRNTYAANFASKKVCKNLDRLSTGEVNLASLRSVKNFTDRLVAEDKKFDIVILNAGVFGIPRTLTEDGLETIFQVNYLSQIYMLMNIEKLLAPNARVVFLTSESHRYVNWPLEKRLLPTEEMFSLPASEYTSIKAFNVSKLCCIFAMHYLGYRWMNTGRSVFSATPAPSRCHAIVLRNFARAAGDDSRAFQTLQALRGKRAGARLPSVVPAVRHDAAHGRRARATLREPAPRGQGKT
ncbi:WW domain-containing oxidoreductase-like isoform X2 [Cydia splendana]|uniref:WW domain-containing oxidoreductase-like isoform X2 n=1 Tax=Cydia splendana TaxID=1100963 RepID=UPI00300D8199